MSKITVYAGDFRKGTAHSISLGMLDVTLQNASREKIPLSSIAKIEVASEEKIKTATGSLVWGGAGMLALGPVGLLAGVLLGGNEKQITFVAEFRDGRRMLASTDSKTYGTLNAAAFNNARKLQTGFVTWPTPEPQRAEERMCINCSRWSSSQTCECGALKPYDAPKRS